MIWFRVNTRGVSCGLRVGLLFLTCALCPAHATDLVQQKAGTNTNSSTITVTLPASVQAGDSLILSQTNDAGAVVSSVTGGGVVWTAAGLSCSHVCTEVWYGLTSSGSGSSVTVSLSKTASNIAASVSEYAGMVRFDSTTSASGIGGTINAGSLTTLGQNEFFVEASGIKAGSTSDVSSGPTNGFQGLTAAQVGTDTLLESAYVTGTGPTGTYSTTWTLQVSDAWDATIVAFRGDNLVQQSTANASGSTITLNLNQNPHVGNALVLSLANDSRFAVSVTGGGVTWAQATSSCNHICTEIWYGLNSSGSGTSITVNYGNTGNIAAQISEYTGVGGVDAVGANNGISASIATASPTTLNANDLLVAAAGVHGASGLTVSAGPTKNFYPLNTAAAAANDPTIVPGYGVFSATGIYSTGWTLSSSAGWDTVIVALKLGPLVQQVANTSTNSTTLPFSLPAKPLAGDGLVLAIANASGLGVQSVTGGGVTTWSKVGSSCSHVCTEMWYGTNSTGSTAAVTATYSGGANAAGNLSEFSGISGLDAFISNSGASSSTSTGNLSTANANDVLVGTAGINYTSISGGPTNSFIGLTAANSPSGHALLESAYNLSTTTGSFSTGWTIPSSVGWDSMIVGLKAAPDSGNGPLSSYYGSGTNTNALQNLILNTSGTRWDYWFQAQETGTITSLRQYFINTVPGYGGGNGATIEIQIYGDNGGKPDTTSLGGVNSYVVCPSGASNCHTTQLEFALLALDQPAAVSAGMKYHIVYRNIDSSPSTNYSSLDGFLGPLGCPNSHPTFTELQFGYWYSSNGGGTWGYDVMNCVMPILDIGYANGFHEGVGYTDDMPSNPVSGSNQVRQQFTVTGPDRTATSVSVYVSLTSGADSLNVALENSSSQVIAQGTAAVDPNLSKWRKLTFSSPVTLQSGQQYYLVLSAPSSSAYAAIALENGMLQNVGFQPGTLLDARSNQAQFSTNSGTSWSEWLYSGTKTPGDLMFYFTLQ
jgi:hypothetical protein